MLLTVAALCAGTVGIATAGEVTGKITLKGTPPPEPGLDKKTAALKADPSCGKLSDGPKNRIFMVGSGGEFGQVVVKVIEGAPAGAPVRSDELVLDQKGCEYLPYVSAVQVGQKFKVRNSDDALHNVHALPKVAGNKESNKAQLPKGPDIEYSYANAEDFLTYKCDVHPWMFAYVAVVANPYFAVSGTDGSFTIKDIPDGKYKIEASHRRAGKVVKDVEVKGGKVTVDFEMTVPEVK